MNLCASLRLHFTRFRSFCTLLLWTCGVSDGYALCFQWFALRGWCILHKSFDDGGKLWWRRRKNLSAFRHRVMECTGWRVYCISCAWVVAFSWSCFHFCFIARFAFSVILTVHQDFWECIVQSRGRISGPYVCGDLSLNMAAQILNSHPI